jgi:hypothetical protein
MGNGYGSPLRGGTLRAHHERPGPRTPGQEPGDAVSRAASETAGATIESSLRNPPTHPARRPRASDRPVHHRSDAQPAPGASGSRRRASRSPKAPVPGNAPELRAPQRGASQRSHRGTTPGQDKPAPITGAERRCGYRHRPEQHPLQANLTTPRAALSKARPCQASLPGRLGLPSRSERRCLPPSPSGPQCVGSCLCG